MRQSIELLGRFLGQLDGNGFTLNQAMTWQVVDYIEGPAPDPILRALEPWPEAQAAVRALLPLEAQTPAAHRTPALAKQDSA